MALRLIRRASMLGHGEREIGPLQDARRAETANDGLARWPRQLERPSPSVSVIGFGKGPQRDRPFGGGTDARGPASVPRELASAPGERARATPATTPSRADPWGPNRSIDGLANSRVFATSECCQTPESESCRGRPRGTFISIEGGDEARFSNSSPWTRQAMARPTSDVLAHAGGASGGGLWLVVFAVLSTR